MNDRIVISGYGFAVPDKVRTNKDPVFDWINKHDPAGKNLFTGYCQRRVLTAEQTLLDIMQPAAKAALDNAGTEAGKIDYLLGAASVSRYNPPSDLSALHHELGLPKTCPVIPLANDYSNFNAALLLADSLIRAQPDKQILICVGTNWSQHVDYRTPEAVSAGDGAAAVIVSRASCGQCGWSLVDQRCLMATEYFGAMIMEAEPQYSNTHLPDWDALQTLYSKPFFHINQQGIDGFKNFAIDQIPTLVSDLLTNNKLSSEDVALVPYQASKALLEAWVDAINPGQVLDTLTEYANMTAASVPVNLASSVLGGRVEKEWLVLLGIGPDMHANGMLLGGGFSS